MNNTTQVSENDMNVLTLEREDKMDEVYYNATTFMRLAGVNTENPEYDASKHLWKEEITKIQNIVKHGKYHKADDTITLSQQYRVKEYAKIDKGRMYLTGKRAGFQNIYNVVRRMVMNDNYVSPSASQMERI
jgi:hypothetical protein